MACLLFFFRGVMGVVFNCRGEKGVFYAARWIALGHLVA